MILAVSADAAGSRAGPFPGPAWLVAGRVTGPDGRVPAEAVLTLIDARGRQAGRALPDAGGGFRLAAPGPGDLVLLASAPGHHPRAYGVKRSAPPPGELDIVLAPLTEQVVGLVRAFPSADPLPGALVVATDEAGCVRAGTRSGPDGGYALGGLPAGRYTVTATAEAMWPAAVGVDVPGSTRSVECTLDMLEPPPAPRDAPDRWSTAKQDLAQPAAGSTSPASSASTSPVWPARTARPPSTTT